MAIFNLTNHSKVRLLQRNIPEPYNLKLQPAGQKIKRKLRVNCPEHDIHKNIRNGYVYWVYKQYIVYVCKQVDVAVYTVITAFDINKKQ